METRKYEKLVVVTFKIEPSQLSRIDMLAVKMRRNRSEIIREALNMYMETLNEAKGVLARSLS